MQKLERVFLLSALVVAACGARTELDGLNSSSSAGGLPSIGGAIATGGSPSTGGSTTTGATSCPPNIPQAGDPCPTVGLYCKYDNELCLIAYQCSTSGEFEWAGDCSFGAGGAASTGGTTATGGVPPAGGTTSTGGSAGTECNGSLEMLSADKGLCVAKMVPITGPPSDAGNIDYKIDATEVTKGQYDAWLATSPSLPASTNVNCGYVTSYAEQRTGYLGPDADHHPVVYVDWCDAYAYCLGVDKRLCGAIGGGSVDYYTGFVDAAASQWYRACSSGGADSYPYGNTYHATYCDGSDFWNDNNSMQTVAVGSLTNCVTSKAGYSGVYDLSGNVWEWEDSCTSTGQPAACRIRGGAFYLGGGALACGYGGGDFPRSVVYNNIGFRCCTP